MPDFPEDNKGHKDNHNAIRQQILIYSDIYPEYACLHRPVYRNIPLSQDTATIFFAANSSDHILPSGDAAFFVNTSVTCFF